MDTLSAEQVRLHVMQFWKAFNTGSIELLSDLYSPHASVFSPGADRFEPGRVAAIRRRREYATAKVEAHPRQIEVTLIGEHAAIAYYNFTSQVTGMTTDVAEARNYTIQHGRASQVFALESDGKLRIIHEHLSVTTPL
ncbi:MAG: nuclear transport factor 2 family protein [Acidobacteria bacterium]|nr:nuclear transport factor 2 family protein [Acidobacteriaceae bacterium]MBV9610514.1 nuclear transport factor 2 family protein [Acidobacteriota bacterium]